MEGFLRGCHSIFNPFGKVLGSQGPWPWPGSFLSVSFSKEGELPRG